MMGGDAYAGICSVNPANEGCLLAVKPMAGRVHGLGSAFPFHFRQSGKRGGRNDAGYAAVTRVEANNCAGFMTDLSSIRSRRQVQSACNRSWSPAPRQAHQFRRAERSQQPAFIRPRILPWRSSIPYWD